MKHKIQNPKSKKHFLNFELCAFCFPRERGFTLVEMIVAVFIFSIVMVVAVGALVSIVQANRKAQTVKTVMNNLNFSFESMTRAIRTGTDFQCTGSPCTSFSFTDKDGRGITYRFAADDDVGRIERQINPEGFLGLTAPEVDIDLLEFYLSSTGQPRVLIIAKGSAGPDDRTRTEFSLQTLATQRFLAR